MPSFLQGKPLLSSKTSTNPIFWANNSRVIRIRTQDHLRSLIILGSSLVSIALALLHTTARFFWLLC